MPGPRLDRTARSWEQTQALAVFGVVRARTGPTRRVPGGAASRARLTRSHGPWTSDLSRPAPCRSTGPMTRSSPPLVSLVTPFYNTEEHLEECIESVLAQTYRDFEYILVDNCSTDRSVEIAARHAALDPRIRLFHNERFVPQLRNYNQALRHISPQSRYFKMVQADDWIFPRCLEAMVAVAEDHPSVGVVSSWRLVGENVGPRFAPRSASRTRTVMSGRDAIHASLVDDVFLFGSQTTVLVRSDIVRARQPFYAEDDFFADADAIYEILAGHDFAFVHEVLTFSRIDKASIGGGVKSYEPLLLDRLRRLRSLGRRYLSADEYSRHLVQQERAYRRFLAEAWLRRREPAFWDFHRRGLAQVGAEIDRSRFLRDAIPVLLHYALRPGTVVRALLRRARRALARGRRPMDELSRRA